MSARKKPRFDALLEEIGLIKAISTETAADDDRIAAAAGEEGDGTRHSKDSPRTVALGKVLKQFGDVVLAQAAAIRKLEARLDALDPGGAGKPLQKAAANLDGEVFMAKALTAQAAGRISGVEVATAEACINAGKQPPGDIVRAVMTEPSAAPAEGSVQ